MSKLPKFAAVKNRIYSTDSPKAVKADKFGYLNAIQYMAPASTSGVNPCSDASPVCIALCLGWYSGQAGMLSNDELETGSNEAPASRVEKAHHFMRNRAAYLLALVRATDNAIKQAHKLGKLFCGRPNGSTDIAWEGIKFCIERDKRGRAIAVTLNARDGKSLFDHYPDQQWVDYTKNPRRFDRALPANYHLTFSRSETNEAIALQLLARGVNVAVIFDHKPETFHGFTVVDGDEHDLRHLDPRGAVGFIIGLSPKGRKAKRDMRGFVVRGYVDAPMALAA